MKLILLLWPSYKLAVEDTAEVHLKEATENRANLVEELLEAQLKQCMEPHQVKEVVLLFLKRIEIL